MGNHLTEHFRDANLLSVFIANWVSLEGCPVERVGRGHYRLKTPQVAP